MAKKTLCPFCGGNIANQLIINNRQPEVVIHWGCIVKVAAFWLPKDKPEVIENFDDLVEYLKTEIAINWFVDKDKPIMMLNKKLTSFNNIVNKLGYEFDIFQMIKSFEKCDKPVFINFFK